jgi:hypothetical protein
MATGWIKLYRDADPWLLGFLLQRPNAWALFSLIAIRARREGGIDPRSGTVMESGEAMIGDFEACGLSRQQYRTAMTQLVSAKIVTTRATNRGTIAKILKSSIYDINADEGNHLDNQPSNHLATIKQPLTRSKEVKKKKPLIGFDAFWNAYPRRIGKQNAVKAWQKIGPSPDLQAVILEALKGHKATEQWQRDGGQFIPHPASWLNGHRWEDELDPQPETPPAADPHLQQAAEEVARRYGLTA